MPASMLTIGPTFFFDFVDPGSYLASCAIDAAGAEDAVEWRGIEVRPFPGPPLDVREPAWASYQESMSEYAEALGVAMAKPVMAPWTRKAHELAEHAGRRNCYASVRRALFRAHFVEGVDIGRVDRLVDIARQEGLDASEAKAALDVDAHADAVDGNRATAEELGIREAPVLAAADGRRLAGFRSPSEIRRWIDETAGTGRE